MSLLKPTNHDARAGCTESDHGCLPAGVRPARSRRQLFRSAGRTMPSESRTVVATRRAALLTWLSAVWLLALVVLGAVYVLGVAIARIG